MNTTKIKKDGRELELLENIPEHYCFIYEITNNLLQKLRQGIKTWISEEIYEKMKVSIAVYDDIRVNAFATYYEGKNYIALSVGLCQRFFDAAKEFAQDEKFEMAFKISDERKDSFIQVIYMYMLNFIIAHEFGHIVHGHLLLNSDNRFIDEIHDEIEKIKNEDKWRSQLMEYDADVVASTINTAIFVQNWTEDIKTLLANFDLLNFSFYLSFSVLAKESQNDFSAYFDKNIDEYGHPHPGIRMFYCLIAMCDLLISNKGVNETTYAIIQSGFHGIFSYEKNVLQKKEIRECYFSVSQTRKGVQHIMNLVNGWNEMVDFYNKYSYILINKTDYVNSMTYFLDENGEFILN